MSRARSDVVGLALVASIIGWIQLTAARAGGDAGPLTGLFLAAAVAYLGARLLTSFLGRSATPFLIVAAATTVVMVSSPESVYSHAARGGPFGFSSLTGAFFLQCGFAGLILVTQRPWLLRPVGVAAAIAFGWVVVATDTRTAIALGIVLVPLITGVAILSGPRWAAVAAMGVFVATLVATLALAATYSFGHRSGPLDELVDRTLSERRVEFWHDGWALMLDHPSRGVGATRFKIVSTAVARDPDEPWAHNEFLQLGAETGVLGVVFLFLIFVWAYARIADDEMPLPIVAIASAALTALAIHACVEYVFQTPAIVAVTSALTGTAAGPYARFRPR